MRKIYLLFLLLNVFYSSCIQGQADCAHAKPFCASTSSHVLSFPNTTNSGNAEAGIDYDCLTTQPNPAWYYMQISTAGNLNFTISQAHGGTPLDVDFIAWGPFLTPTCGPDNLNSTTKVDCSFSPRAVEYLNISHALVGSYYMVLITNFSNQSGSITLTQTSGNGATNCDILCPLSITGGDVPVCEGAVLTAHYVNSISPTFQWYHDDHILTGERGITYTPTTSGTYCIVANSPGCGVDQTVCVVVPEPTPIPIGQPTNPLKGCTFATFDLTANTAKILTGLTALNYVVSYHTTLAGALNNDLSIPLPTSYSGLNGETIFVSIHDLVHPLCITTTQFKLKTLPCGPIPVKPDDLLLCDDISNDGVETFNLSQQNETIMGANNPTKFTLTYHLSLADAQNDVSPITSINNYINSTPNSQTIYVRLEENAIPANYGTTEFNLIVNPIAIVSIVGSTICSPIKAVTNIPGTYSYEWTVPVDVLPPGNVSTFTTTLPGTYSVIVTNTATGCVSEIASGVVSDSTFPTVVVNSAVVCTGTQALITATPGTSGNYTYVWHVPSGPNPGNVASFLTTIAGTYRVKITNEASSCVSANGIGIVTLLPLPTVTVNSKSICQGGIATIKATPGITTDNYIYTWTVPAGAMPVGNVSSFQTTIGGTYSVRITNTTTNCVSESASGVVTVIQLPAVLTNVLTPTICSGQMTKILLLTTDDFPDTSYSWTVLQDGVIGASDGAGELIYQTLSTIGDIVGTATYTITPTSNGCIGQSTTVIITVVPIPVATATIGSQIICSDTKTSIALSSTVSGTTFSWTVIENNVRGAYASTGNSIEQELTATSVTPGQVIYRIVPTVGDCPGNPIDVVITVSPNPEIFGFASTYVCDGDFTNITLSPNLPETTLAWTVAETNVTGASDGTGLVIHQALTVTGTTDGTVVYTVTPTANGCVGKPIQITVIVKPLPAPEIVGGLICVDELTDIASQTYTLDTGFSISDYEFEWYLDNVLIQNAVGSSYEATQSGVYSVKATNIITGCISNKFSATVTDAFVGQSVDAVVTDAFSDNPTITATVIGGNVEYVYQLDNGTPQSSNVFSQVSMGTHTVYVTDVNGCTSVSTQVVVIGYPHYFTPNGDGVNDSWNISDMADDQPDAKIFIYDRYGKLMTLIKPNGKGWDGTYNGSSMPSTDYWFTIEYAENGINKVFKSHFSLKRD